MIRGDSPKEECTAFSDQNRRRGQKANFLAEAKTMVHKESVSLAPVNSRFGPLK
jgi:hypothetical protein